MKKTFFVGLSLWLILSGCMVALVPGNLPLPPQGRLTTYNRVDQFLCAIGGDNGNNSVVKILDLSTQQLRSVFVPGFVQNMAGDKLNQKLYISSVQSGTQAQSNLYEVDIRQATIKYLVAFSQVGIAPKDFLVDGEKIYVTGEREKQGVLYSYDLINKGWRPIVSKIRPGILEWGTNNRTLQVVHFGEDELTRTTVDIPNRQVTNVFTFEHKVPFGNNLGLPSPHGFYHYTLHQLKDQVVLYSHNLESGILDVLEDPHTHQGVLYSSVITRDGRYLYATIESVIQRYELKGTQLVKLPPIELQQQNARHLALAENGKTLYISHENSNKVSRIRFNADMTYQVDFMAFPGENNELVVF